MQIMGYKQYLEDLTKKRSIIVQISMSTYRSKNMSFKMYFSKVSNIFTDGMGFKIHKKEGGGNFIIETIYGDKVYFPKSSITSLKIKHIYIIKNNKTHG